MKKKSHLRLSKRSRSNRLNRIIFSILLYSLIGFAQAQNTPPKTQIMPLGVFHFNYPNLDVVKTENRDQISVLDEPFQVEIRRIADAIGKYQPTIIAIESLPSNQYSIDSLYNLYIQGKFELRKNEIYQLGFRIGKLMGIEKMYCVDDMGHHYDKFQSLFSDSIRLKNFLNYIQNSPDSIYFSKSSGGKIKSIISELVFLNDPDRIKQRLGVYLVSQFKYEEVEGDFLGVDFESGRWFNRNLRIFRNLQRIPQTADDRVLLIIGADHLNILNHLLEVSPEFELISPLPLLIDAKQLKDNN